MAENASPPNFVRLRCPYVRDGELVDTLVSGYASRLYGMGLRILLVLVHAQ